MREVALSKIQTPPRAPVERAFFNNLLKHSVIKIKSNGDRGHPCLNPHSTWKKPDAAPYMRILKEAEVKQHMIQFMKRWGKPI